MKKSKQKIAYFFYRFVEFSYKIVYNKIKEN